MIWMILLGSLFFAIGRIFIPSHGLSWPGTYEAFAHIWVGMLLLAGLQPGLDFATVKNDAMRRARCFAYQLSRKDLFLCWVESRFRPVPLTALAALAIITSVELVMFLR